MYINGQNFVFFNHSATDWLETLRDGSGHFNKAKNVCMAEDGAGLVGKLWWNPPVETISLANYATNHF